MIKVQFDGAITHNPGGTATYGWLFYNRGILATGSGRAPEATTVNQVEYRALIEALKELLKLGLQRNQILVEGDSKLIINQMQGRWKVKNRVLKTLHRIAKKQADQFPRITFRWIARELNDADELSRMAL